jgi:D-glycerate 3-kinase
MNLEPAVQKLNSLLAGEPHVEKRVTSYYQPILHWAVQLREKIHRASGSKIPIMVGINGPQGAGKTTLTRALIEAASAVDLKSVSLSIDDFYLTRAEQLRLAAEHRHNPLLQQRGYPGTHDVALGAHVLRRLKKLTAGETLSCPVYEKSAHHGQGDRAPESSWKSVTGPLDLIFIEGWMLGFPPAAPESLPDENLKRVNEFLPAYKSWTSELDGFIQIDTDNLENIVRWRVEAEKHMIASGKTGMSESEITAYVNKFIPAYKIYVPLLRKNPPVAETLHFTLALNRLPVS